MKYSYLTALVLCLLATTVKSQQVVISMPADKKLLWDRLGTTNATTVGFSIINCPPARFKKVDCIAVYAAGTAQPPIFNSFTFAGPSITFPNNSCTISIATPLSIPSKVMTIVLRFQLTLKDTVIFNYDTLTINKTIPVPPTTNTSWRTKENKVFRWLKDNSNTFKSSVTQFTDFNGFDNQKPNGLLQEELVLKFPIAKNRRQLSLKHKDAFYQYFRSIVFTGLFNRIDKSKNSQDYPIGSTLPYKAGNKDSIQNFLTTMDIFKYSSLQLGINLNVFTLHTGNFRINLDYEFGLLRNRPYFADTIKVLDTFITKNDLRHIYSFVQKFEFYANNDKLIGKNFGAAFNGGVMLIRLRDGYYKQFDAAVVDATDRATTLLPAFGKRTARPIWFFAGTFQKFWGENNKSVTFLRITYNYQTGKYISYTGDPKVTTTNFNPNKFQSSNFHNHFLQLQLGITLDINKLLESRK